MKCGMPNHLLFKHPLKHAFFACRMPAPTSLEAAPTPPCPLMNNYLVSRLSFFVRRLSSVAILFVPLRFVIIFYSKILIIEPTHGALPALYWRKMG